MEYFTINASDDIAVIGDYPQVQKSKNYKLASPNSYWNVKWNRFPEFEPHYDIIISDKAKPTNLLGSLSGFYGLTVDGEFKELIEQSHLPPYQFYPINVSYKDKAEDYYWFHFIDSFLDYVSFNDSEFELYQKSPFAILDTIKLESLNRLRELENQQNFEKGVRIKYYN